MKYEKNKSVVHAIKVLCSIAVFVCGLYLSFRQKPREPSPSGEGPGWQITDLRSNAILW